MQTAPSVLGANLVGAARALKLGVRNAEEVTANVAGAEVNLNLAGTDAAIALTRTVTSVRLIVAGSH